MDAKLQQDIDKVYCEIERLFKDENTGHDIEHLKRVLNNAIIIQKKEGGDEYVIAISALVHDIHRLMQNRAGKYVAPKDSLDEVKQILVACGVNEDKIPAILDAVKTHEKKDVKNIPIEWQVLQDADALDALGKIGLNRTLKYCKTHKIPVVDTKYPLDCSEYAPDVNPISTCHYIYRTMIPQGENMHTATGQKMASRKIKILKDFVEKNYNSAVLK